MIRRIVERHKRRYGSPRVRQGHGKRVSQKRVARLMRENGLNARRGWRRPQTTDSGQGLGVCENVLNRDFSAEGPGQKWVSAITYLRVLGGWLYLTVVVRPQGRRLGVQRPDGHRGDRGVRAWDGR